LHQSRRVAQVPWRGSAYIFCCTDRFYDSTGACYSFKAAVRAATARLSCGVNNDMTDLATHPIDTTHDIPIYNQTATDTFLAFTHQYGDNTHVFSREQVFIHRKCVCVVFDYNTVSGVTERLTVHGLF